MKKIKFSAVLILLVIVSGCLSVKISSIKSEERIAPITKLFVSLRGFKQTEVFYENLRFNLFEGFNKRSVQSSYYIKRALSLETEVDVANRMAEFGPDKLLAIDISEIQSSVGAVENSYYSFDIRLMNPDKSKILWRATLDLKSSVKSQSSAKKAAMAIIDKMAEDGLINKQ